MHFFTHIIIIYSNTRVSSMYLQIIQIIKNPQIFNWKTASSILNKRKSCRFKHDIWRVALWVSTRRVSLFYRKISIMNANFNPTKSVHCFPAERRGVYYNAWLFYAWMGDFCWFFEWVPNGDQLSLYCALLISQMVSQMSRWNWRYLNRRTNI